MNNLLTAVKEFNDRHAANKTFAHFEYAGHVSMFVIRVDRTVSGYVNKEDVQSVYYEYCYLDGTHGSQPTIEAMTEHFVAWVKEYEDE